MKKESISLWFSELIRVASNPFKGTVKRIYPIRLAGVIIFSLLLPVVPNILLDHEYKLVITSVNDKAAKPDIDLSQAQIQPVSFMSHFVGQDFPSASVSVCLRNNSNPFPTGWQVTGSTTPEWGAMSIEVQNLENSNSTKIYARMGTTTCQTFPSGRLRITNNIEINTLVGRGAINGQQFTATYYNLGQSSAKVRVIFDWWQYFMGVFLSLLGIGATIALIGAVIGFLKRK